MKRAAWLGTAISLAVIALAWAQAPNLAGTYDAQLGPLKVVLHVTAKADGGMECSLDSPNQGVRGLACADWQREGANLSFSVPAVKGTWKGTVSKDGTSLDGIWDQGVPQTLRFLREGSAAAAAAAAPPAPSYDAAMAPINAADMEQVLNRDLAGALADGELAPGTGAGVAIGVVEHGVSRVFSYGTAKTDSVFEIGSLTKTFTALILAQMALQGKVKLDEPVRALLPPGTLGPPKGEEITLLDLATQHSGLPRMPDNFHPANDANPYADYSAAKLYAYLRAHGDAHPAQAGFLYSNLGFGLLGQGLSVRAGMPYAALVRQEVAVPLGLKDTVVALSPDQRRRLLPGHDAQHHVVHNWDLNALSGAGAIRSTAEDMLSYLEANLNSDKLRPAAGTAAARTIAAALTSQHVLRADAGPSMRIGMAWLHFNDGGPYWHNGATGGYSSYAFFSTECDCAAVVLVNTAPGAGGGYADRVGEHIYQRLTGKAALSLAH